MNNSDYFDVSWFHPFARGFGNCVFLKTGADLRNMKIKCVCAWTFFPRLVQSGLHTFAAAELNGLWWLLRKASRAASNLQQRFSVAGGGGGRGL